MSSCCVCISTERACACNTCESSGVDPPASEKLKHEDAKRPVVSRKVMTLRGGGQWTHKSHDVMVSRDIM